MSPNAAPVRVLSEEIRGIVATGERTKTQGAKMAIMQMWRDVEECRRLVRWAFTLEDRAAAEWTLREALDLTARILGAES